MPVAIFCQASLKLTTLLQTGYCFDAPRSLRAMTRRKRLPEKIERRAGASLLRLLIDGTKHVPAPKLAHPDRRSRDVLTPERSRSYNRASKELAYGKSSFQRAQSWGSAISMDIADAGGAPLQGIEALHSLGACGKYPGNMRRDFMRMQGRLRR